MTAQPTHPRPMLGRIISVGVSIALVVGGIVAYYAAGWKSSVFTFDLIGGDYRVRLTGSSTECARLERETNFDDNSRWQTAGLDCAWPRVAGGDGWLAG